jgi:succinyl-CoA synthetase alpha subunit
MSILLDGHTRVLVQGITGKGGSVQTGWMIEYGTNVVAGVTPGKGGSKVEGVPVFDSVGEAVEQTGAEASVFFVPPPFVMDAFFETIAAGIKLIVVVPEYVPVHDVMAMRHQARRYGVIALGPTTPGILTPGEAKVGIMPASLFSAGRVGVISRSGTLAHETGAILSENSIGQSTVVGLGADPVVLTNLEEILALFEKDEATDAVLILGEVGGVQEERAAQFISRNMSKPVSAYIAGRFAPEGKRMGHAGASTCGSTGTVESKCDALKGAGVDILQTPIEMLDWALKHSLQSH